MEPSVGHASLGCQCPGKTPWTFPAEGHRDCRIEGCAKLQKLPHLGAYMHSVGSALDMRHFFLTFSFVYKIAGAPPLVYRPDRR